MKKRKLGKTIYERHLFVLAIKDLVKNLVVYRTCNGPIFAAFSSNSKIKRYLNGEGQLFATFECSHDLRKPTEEGERRLLELFDKFFIFKNSKELLIQVKKAAKVLSKMEITEDMDARLENWKPSVGIGFTHQQLKDMGYYKKEEENDAENNKS